MDVCLRCKELRENCVCEEMAEIEQAEREADAENEAERIEAGLPYYKLHHHL